MPTRVQFRRGTTAEHSTFTGAVGEVTVDTDKDVVVVHDGVTAGGYPLARQDLNNVSSIADTKLATISTANKVSLSALDIDGATDIGAALADADLFIVDDGAGGTNRKAAASRITDYAFGKVSGDIAITSSGVASISAGTIVNADINASAAIDHSKLANITAGSVLLGNASNVPTATALSGDVTINSSGVTAISAGVIVNADINASAAIVDTKLDTIATADKVSLSALNIDGATDIGGALENGDLFIVDDGAGGTNRKAEAFRMAQLTYSGVTGDITVASGGTAAISAGVIVNADVNASAAIAGTKISPNFGSQTITTTGVVSAALGAAATPSLTFTGDLNTGIYSPGADQVAISTNGTGRLFVDASGNSNLGLSAALPTVSTGNRVFTLHSNNGAAEIVLFNPDANDTAFSHLTFGGIRTNTGATARISANRRGEIVFANNDAFNGVNTVTERLRITSAGLVGIGTSSPTYLLQAAGTIASVGSFGNFAALQTAGGTGFRWTLSNDGTFRLQRTLDGFANASVPIFIDSSDRVGIGTTPATALHVSAADTELRVQSTSSANGFVRFVNTSGSMSIGMSGAATNTLLTYDRTNNQKVHEYLGGASGYHIWYQNGSEAARIDSSRRLLVGTSTAGGTELVQVQGGSGDSTLPGAIALRRSSIGNGGDIGFITFTDSSGNIHAQIKAICDGVPATNDYPGAVVFSTTADGASSPTERMRITNDGRVLLGATTGDSGLVVDRAVSRAALGITAPARIYTGAGTITDNTTVASGTVVHGTIVSFDNPAIAATNASVTYTRASTLYVDGAPTAGTNVTISNRYGLFVNAGNTVLGENVTIGGAVIPASATASLSLINGTIPSASVVNGVSLYAEDVSASSELKVRDEAGNITTLSPHNFSLIPEGPSEEMAWAFYSERDGTKINVDMLKAIRLLEQLTGEQLVYLSEAQ